MGESLNEEVEGGSLYGGAQGGGGLNEEVKWRPLYGGAQEV